VIESYKVEEIARTLASTSGDRAGGQS
jgi:hypothetical protein